MALDFEKIIDQFTSWFDVTNKTKLLPNENVRTWFLLPTEITEYTREAIWAYFERTGLNQDYVQRKNSGQAQAYSYQQTQISLIAATQKSFVIRHKNRMQFYRDDCSQKIRNTGAVNQSSAEFQYYINIGN